MSPPYEFQSSQCTIMKTFIKLYFVLLNIFFLSTAAYAQLGRLPAGSVPAVDNSTNTQIGLLRLDNITEVRNKEATVIIDDGRAKLELKEFKAAELYFNLRQYKAAAIAYTNLMENYPDSEKSDAYKVEVIRSYFEYAVLSIDEKKEERFTKVIEQCNEFADRFPESQFKGEVNNFLSISQNNIKAIKNEQVKTSA